MFLCKITVQNKHRSIAVYEIVDEEVAYFKDGQPRFRKREARAWSHRYGASAIAQNRAVAEMMAAQQVKL